MPGHTISPSLRTTGHPPSYEGVGHALPMWEPPLPAPGFPDGITHHTAALQWSLLLQENPTPSEGNTGCHRQVLPTFLESSPI